MPIAKNAMRGSQRFYPCPLCGMDHPSITTLLSVISSPALMGWMSKNGTSKLNLLAGIVKADAPDTFKTKWAPLAEERWKLTEDTAFWKSGKETGAEAADVGTLCHAWIEAHLAGKTPSIEALPEQGQKAVMSMLAWEGEHHLETIKMEQTFYHCKLNYAGTADWVGRLDGELSLGDWKTSTGVFFNYAIQSWGYVLADEAQNSERLYRQIFIGRFGKDGSSEVKLFKRNEFPSIDTARDVILACGQIFAATRMWEKVFPYQRKPRDSKQGDKP